jgi:hypothetical protein
MKRIIYFIVTFSILIFFECDKKPPPEPEEKFDISLIQGIYKGGFHYYPATTNNDGEIVRGLSYIEDLSMSTIDDRIEVTEKVDGKFTISFHDLIIPDLDCKITNVKNFTVMGSTVYFRSIILDDNQAYSSEDGLAAGDFSNYHSNIFLQLDIKSNDPDSTYILAISGYKNKN